LINKGVPLTALRKNIEAIGYYDKALILNESAGTLGLKGQSLENLGRYDQAIDEYESPSNRSE